MFIVFIVFICFMKQRMIIDIDYDYECNSLNHLHLIVNTIIHSHLLKQHSLFHRKDYCTCKCWLSSREVHLQFISIKYSPISHCSCTRSCDNYHIDKIMKANLIINPINPLLFIIRLSSFL